jgi:hypothetical protein
MTRDWAGDKAVAATYDLFGSVFDSGVRCGNMAAARRARRQPRSTAPGYLPRSERRLYLCPDWRLTWLTIFRCGRAPLTMRQIARAGFRHNPEQIPRPPARGIEASDEG